MSLTVTHPSVSSEPGRAGRPPDAVVAADPSPLPGLAAVTLCEAFQLTAAASGDQVALRTPGGAIELSWTQYAERVRAVAGGLAGLGVGCGDTVAMMLVNRPEFHILDTAALHLGAIPFSVYNTSTPEQIEYVFANAGNRVLITERAFADVVRAVHAPLLERVLILEEGLPEADHPGFAAAWRRVTPHDLATLIYTSGTTGPPKGVQLTHGNLMFAYRAYHEVVPIRPAGRVVSYLPCAHIADRIFSHYASIVTGATVTCVPDPARIIEALPDARPTGFLGVPRIWEKLKAGLEAQGVRDPSVMPEPARAGLRARLGLDDADWLGSGAAPIAPEVLEYFMALGLPIAEGWAMSETAAAGTINPPDAVRVGTVGRPVLGVELSLAEDGELLLRGPNVMLGYRGEPEQTAEAIDPDGWLHTGDIAKIDPDGYVRIVDRKKELIINSGGKNMSPANIEQRLKAASPLIGQACAIGDRRPYNVALIVLDPDAAAAHTHARGVVHASMAELASDPGIRAAVETAVSQANRHLSRVEQLKRFSILPGDWSPHTGELTPTLKLKRRVITENYAAEIDALYPEGRIS
ncbi:MAG: long-chain fatty acid--CoA ligase [Solirubrobacterales bacterium]|nr:long-chain fatty acid--CoA ligase [Solirubrobacterales bacterium]